MPVGVEALRLGPVVGCVRAQQRRLWGGTAVQATSGDGSGLSSASWGGGSSGCRVRGLLAKVMQASGESLRRAGCSGEQQGTDLES